MTALLPDALLPDALPETAVRLDTVETALDALRRGLPVLVVDDEDRENEGDVIMAACHATPEWLAWAVRHTSGVICAPLPNALADRLQLPPMVTDNQDPHQTAFTVSVDARAGITTGISAADRALTLRLLAEAGTAPGDLVRPGHIFPLRARDGGVLERPGHTEAAVDLCRLAGLPPVGVISEVVEDDGTLMMLPALRDLADTYGLPLVTIKALVAFRLEQELHHSAIPAQPVHRVAVPPVAVPPVAVPPGAEPRVERVARTSLPSGYGSFEAIGYRDLVTGDEHIALVKGSLGAGAVVRVHSECLTGDALGSLRCDCGPQLQEAMRRIGAEGGAIVYLRGHEGRGIGLLAKLAAYALQDGGLDTVAANVEQGLPVDAREYASAAAILTDLGVNRVRLLTNNPAKVDGLREHGVEVAERLPLVVGVGDHNSAYLRTKRDQLGHQLEIEEDAT